jgi:hypothetical protein
MMAKLVSKISILLWLKVITDLKKQTKKIEIYKVFQIKQIRKLFK